MASRRRIEENRAAYLFLAPWFVGLAFITSGPLLVSFFLAFTTYIS